ncbi:phosphoenolpyruvate--protein phosphotransferase [Parasphaerochaeta coccoides]|uniref:Phosphoenolpyruvate-protein phosphotransferase n=1 Tax=Parasphaerochaeta coccoides (strain ATCC BAA-1237 / DSM 17374 / SPN1) TaxID=760011 RepID=F4GKK0_PARC1|nr:phosphoenolpyruvate--protein phosphotransferase [Parasphaerochaeta coccoides]AEC02883.1 phosphoenolpyruvate-protein phosphotransferase [Parasphaerochaeta coccoides DSM 17374]
MKVLTGIGASQGLALGPALVYRHAKQMIPHTKIRGSKTRKHALADSEEARFDSAVEAVKTDIMAFSDAPDASVSPASHEHADILDTHLMMLQDSEFHATVKNLIRTDAINAEWAVERACDLFTSSLEAAQKDAVLTERTVDIKDVGTRIIRSLTGTDHGQIVKTDKDVILVCDSVLPSEVMDMDRSHVKGIILADGSRTSHAAILFRSYNIPAVVAVRDVLDQIAGDDEIFIDGTEGEVIIRMEPDDHSRMQSFCEGRWATWERTVRDLAFHKAVTTDGKFIPLKANVEVLAELDMLAKIGCDGIGLYRTEFLFIHSHSLPSEDKQFAAYRAMVKGMEAQGAVTIRTLDIGGDKIIPGMELGESNPALGWRAVRFTLAEPAIFLTQLRAILRASAYGKVRIMFPMISGLLELEMALKILEQAKSELRSRNMPFDEDITVGTMIEVPSAALCSDILARKVDFFSIGTNDLIQYTIAVDRSNSRTAYLYRPLHPGVLRLLKIIIDNAHQAGITVESCGEMAGTTTGALLLMGLGIDGLSMTSQSLLDVRKAIRSISYDAAREMALHALNLTNAQEIEDYIRKTIHDRSTT